jgi:hypothetical protein
LDIAEGRAGGHREEPEEEALKTGGCAEPSRLLVDVIGRCTNGDINLRSGVRALQWRE